MECEGLNVRSREDSSVKGAAVSHYCSENSVSLLGMLETKVSLDREERIRGSLPFSWEYATNGSLGPRGRIWVMWNPRVFKVEVLRCSSQVISCTVETLDGKLCFVASFVYLENERAGRVEAWNELRVCRLVSFLLGGSWRFQLFTG